MILTVVIAVVALLLLPSSCTVEEHRQIKALRKAVEQSPDDPAVLAALAMELQSYDSRHHDGGSLHAEILDLYRRAFDLAEERCVPRQQLALWHSRRGSLRMMMRDMSASIQDLQKCVDTLDDSSEPSLRSLCNLLLGQALHKAANLQESSKAFRHAMTEDATLGSHARSLFGLVQVTLEDKTTTNDSFKALLREVKDLLHGVKGLLASAQVSPSDVNQLLVDLYFSCFVLQDHLGRRRAAWKHLTKGNAANKLLFHPFDPEQEVRNTAQIQDIFQRGFWPSPSLGHPSQVPVFIVGLMRSGSTLVEQILSSHSEVYGIGEDSIFNGMLGKVRDDFVKASSREQQRQVLFQRGGEIVQRMLDKAEMDITCSQEAHCVRAGVVDDAGGATVPQNEGAERSVKHVVDKMLFNYRNVGFIHLVFPHAKVIHVIRDPMDTIFSCYKHKFEDDGLQWASDFKHLLQKYVLYRRFMEHWAKVLPGRVVTVRYEDLVNNQEGVSRRLIKLLGLEWEDQVLRFYETQRAVHTFSVGQVREPLFRSGMGAWRRYKDFLAPVREQLVELLGGEEHYDWPGVL